MVTRSVTVYKRIKAIEEQGAQVVLRKLLHLSTLDTNRRELSKQTIPRLLFFTRDYYLLEMLRMRPSMLYWASPIERSSESRLWLWPASLFSAPLFCMPRLTLLWTSKSRRRAAPLFCEWIDLWLLVCQMCISLRGDTRLLGDSIRFRVCTSVPLNWPSPSVAMSCSDYCCSADGYLRGW